MPVRPFRSEDATPLVAMARYCARGESDFVLNPLWESEAELWAEFERFGIAPEENLLVADPADVGEALGLVGFLRRPGDRAAGILGPIVAAAARGRGAGGELLRAALAAAKQLGLETLTAGIGTRNRGGFSLLASQGFRPVRQSYLMRCTRAPESAGPEADGLAIEPARTSDAEEILALHLACGLPGRDVSAVTADLGDGRHGFWLARRRGELVGFVELETHWPERPWVAFVGVEPELRDRGVGSGLVAWAVARAFEAGARSAQLMLSPANRTALRAYEKVGFRRHRLVDVLERRVSV